MGNLAELIHTVRFESIQCGGCGLIWAVDAAWLAERRKDGKTFHCPNGCNRAFVETEATRLRKQLEAEKSRTENLRQEAKAQRERADHLERSREGLKGHLTRLKQRVGHGVCPCCKRTFKQLSAHMKSKHPDFIESKRLRFERDG